VLVKRDVTVCIPTIKPRYQMLMRAIESVGTQLESPAAINVAYDVERQGAAATRQRALDGARTTWVAFLDDDDWWYPEHLGVLLNLAESCDADYVYSWFSGNNPFPMHQGRQMDVNDPHHTTMNVLVRTEIAQAVGFTNHPDANPLWPGEDWNFLLGCIRAGARFAGTGQVTWHYNVHGGNTSGLPSRW
jgi:glycosyltransferase involved in cell wall biosynthesis